MSQLIQFPCPACGTQLRLPLTAAAQQGPCPSCRKEIVAPDPQRGIGGQLAAAVQAPAPAEPVAVAPKKATPPPSPRDEPPPAPPRKQPLIPACFLSAAVGLAVGFALGTRSKPESPAPLPVAVETTPPAPPVPEPTPVKIVIEALTPEPAPTPEEPAPEPPPPETSVTPDPPVEETPAPPPTPVKASAAAEAALRAFLEAPDWASRSVHVLFPDRVRATMEAYSHEVPDGPTNFGSIAAKQSQIDEATGNTLFIFVVTTEKFPDGIPVAVKETASGWLVDWLTFIEFRDGLFEKFLAGPVDQAGAFHLLATTPLEDPNATQNPNFTAYLVRSPMGGDPQTAFVKNGTPAATTIAAQTAGGRAYAPVLELVKRSTPDQREFLEILAVRADDWFPRDIP